MNKNILLAVLLVSYLGTGCGKNISPRGPLESFSNHLDRRIPELMSDYQVPGLAIALIRDGRIVWSRSFGYAETGNGQQLSGDALFRAESISKSVTAFGVMKLVERGLIDLDAPVKKYLGNWKLPDSPFDTDKVTVRMLLSGNAGMPLGEFGREFKPGSPMPSLAESLAVSAHLVREPGSGFFYSNVGFHLLELVIEKVSKRPFAEYMRDEVLLPLGMKNSSFEPAEQLARLVPMGYDLDGNPVPLYVYPEKSSGGLLSTLGDISRFAAAAMKENRTDHPVLSRRSIQEIYSRQVDIPGMFGLVADAYGFGHFVETLSGGGYAVWHGGQGHGWMSHFHSAPESGDGIVILTNSQRSWPLMAEVLADWSRWSGFAPVKMSRIRYGAVAIRGFILTLSLISAWLLYRLVRGMAAGKLRFSSWSRNRRSVRLLQFLAGACTLAALAWAASQPYLFVSSIFPGLSGWAAAAIAVLAVQLVINSFIVPARKTTGATD